jgi:hypothetical protein
MHIDAGKGGARRPTDVVVDTDTVIKRECGNYGHTELRVAKVTEQLDVTMVKP